MHCRTEDRCLVFLLSKRIFCEMVPRLLVLAAMIAAGSVGLEDASAMGSIERVTLKAGQFGDIPFELEWLIDEDIVVYPYFTLHFNSKEGRPFNVNGENDPLGFLDETQSSRYTVTKTQSIRGFISVNVHITHVQVSDAAVYVFTLILFDHPNNFNKALQKQVEVQIPRGPARCRIRNSTYSPHLREVNCRAKTGEYNTTLTCYQNGRKIPYKCHPKISGQHTLGVFWLSEFGHVSCCSHDINIAVNESLCKDYTWHNKLDEKIMNTFTITGPEIRNEPLSVSPSVTVTDSGSSKLSETCCPVLYLSLFTIIVFLFQRGSGYM